MEKEELEKRLKAKDEEIQALKEAQAKRDAEAKQAAVLADAKPHLKKSILRITRLCVKSRKCGSCAGHFTKDEAAKLSDEEIPGAYQTAKAVVAKLADERKSLGNILLGDTEPKAAPK